MTNKTRIFSIRKFIVSLIIIINEKKKKKKSLKIYYYIIIIIFAFNMYIEIKLDILQQ